MNLREGGQVVGGEEEDEERPKKGETAKNVCVQIAGFMISSQATSLISSMINNYLTCQTMSVLKCIQLLKVLYI